MSGVHAADVEGGIGLGIAKLLRLGEHVAEAAPRGFHGCQDIIAGSIENAIDARDAVGTQPLAQGLDDRNAAGNGCLEIEGEVALLGGLGQRDAVMREQGLVGRDYGQSARDGGFDRGLCDTALAAHQLDIEVDVGRVRHLDRIVEPGDASHREPAILAPGACRNGGELKRASAARCEGEALLAQDTCNRGPDCAETGDAYAK